MKLERHFHLCSSSSYMGLASKEILKDIQDDKSEILDVYDVKKDMWSFVP